MVTAIGHVAAQDLHLPVLQRPRARDETEECRFSHAIGSDHADNLTRGQIKRNPVERQRPAISQANVAKTDDRPSIVVWGDGHFGRRVSRRAGQG